MSACELTAASRGYPTPSGYCAWQSSGSQVVGGYFMKKYPWTKVPYLYVTYKVKTCLPGWNLSRSTGICTKAPPQNHGGTCKKTGNPIATGVGNKFESSVDMSFPGGLVFRRFYGSDHIAGWGGPFVKWSHNYARRLMYSHSDKSVRSIAADGKVLLFTASGQDYVAPAGVRDLLVPQRNSNNDIIGWTYLAIDRRQIDIYGSEGELQEVIDLSGKRVTLAYDPNQMPGVRLDSITDDYGKSITLQYDSAGRLEKLISPAASEVLYAADALGNLSTVTYPDDDTDPTNNPQLIHHYNEPAHTGGANLPNAMTGITHPGGIRYSTFQYNADGMATSTEHAQGAGHFDLAYGPDFTSTVVTDYRGTQRTHHFATVAGVVRPTGVSQPGGAGCDAASSSISYDAVGNVSAKSDFNGNQTCYATDAARNLEAARIEGLDSTQSCPTDVTAATPGTGQRKISSEWHPLWRMKTRVAAPMRITTWVYNGEPDPTNQGQILTCAPPEAEVADGVPIAVLCKKVEQATTDETGGAGFAATAEGAPRIWQYTYDELGKMLTLDGPRTDVADVTTYQYWAADATCPGAAEGTGMDKGCRGRLQSVTNAANHTTSYTKYNAHGQVLSYTNPNGLVHSVAYDARDRVISKTVNGRSTAYTYDPRGLMTRITQPDGSYVEYVFDDAQRQIGVRDNLGNAIDYVLDAGGNQISQTVKDATGALRRAVTREYDALSRMQRETRGEVQ